ncbi:uncharacterized protein [Nicotiana sylvestris]|uniref:Uncharacterized protein isoform X3 n=1 Tax=Nicotiana tabacum TaxID=4097 RepID=A0A1S4DII3_TOBAC|nr:PREDICTED: uncharacterized protein LOC107830222 isoform X3 [Nicotiana tabacum]XP_016513199.1 PREDICTED: uncharacterized protein LOC107830222 isoform X3 [Nicotiana tabacum]
MFFSSFTGHRKTDMTRGRGRGSAGRISKSSARGNSATHRNIPTIPIPTVTHQQGGTSSSSRPNHINQVQTSGPSSTPPIQTSGNSSTPPVYVEPSPMTPNQSNTVDEGISHNNAIGEGISTQSNAIGEGECNSSLAQQTLVFLSSTGLEPSRLCSEYKYENFKNELHPNGINWKGVPKELKEFYFGEFKKAFYWDSLIDREVKHLWGSKAARRYSDFICKIKKDKDIIQPDFVPKDVWDNWMELWKDPKCVKKSEINAKYRCGGGTAIAIGTHTGGSITIGEHRKRIAIEKGRDPTPSELHLHVHTHGHDEKSFVSERSRLVHEKYQQILQQQTQTQSDIDQSLAFYQAAGGEKKRRIYVFY